MNLSLFLFRAGVGAKQEKGKRIGWDGSQGAGRRDLCPGLLWCCPSGAQWPNQPLEIPDLADLESLTLDRATFARRFNFKARTRDVRVGLDLRSEPLLASAFGGGTSQETAHDGDREPPVRLIKNGLVLRYLLYKQLPEPAQSDPRS